MKQRQNTGITYLIGILMIMSSFIGGRFMIIRPNRIENGIVMTIRVALEERFFLLATLFLFLVIIILIHQKYEKPILILVASMLLFEFFMYLTGSGATEQVEAIGSSARASLGSGFWLMFTGLVIIIWQSMNHAISHGLKFGQVIVLTSCILIVAVLYGSHHLSNISIIRELSDKSDRIMSEIIRHMQLTLSATGTGLIISLFLSYGAYKKPKLERAVSAISNFAQVVPTLSLLGLLMIPLALLAIRFPLLKSMGISGIGFFPAYVVLTLYTLLPMTSNTIAGFRSIPPSISEAARAMGMNPKQLLWRIELPMAFPAIYVGFRTALVQTVGNCILAGLVGGGGLGAILFLGLAQSAPDLVIVASLLVVMIAVVLGVFLTSLEGVIRKRLRGELIND
jgi:osmoprotectant transport system permease protein